MFKYCYLFCVLAADITPVNYDSTIEYAVNKINYPNYIKEDGYRSLDIVWKNSFLKKKSIGSDYWLDLNLGLNTAKSIRQLGLIYGIGGWYKILDLHKKENNLAVMYVGLDLTGYGIIHQALSLSFSVEIYMPYFGLMRLVMSVMLWDFRLGEYIVGETVFTDGSSTQMQRMVRYQVSVT